MLNCFIDVKMQGRSIELSETIDIALVTVVSKNLNQSLNLLPNCLFFAQNYLYLTMCIIIDCRSESTL
jgi:hypothetical protein